MSAALLQEEECDMEVYLLAFVFPELLVVSVTSRPIHPQEMRGKKKVKLYLSLSECHSRKKTWDVEVYLFALVFLEPLVVSVTSRPIHPQEMRGKKGKVVPKFK